MEVAGPSSGQASQATHMDTIDTDTQTNRDLLQEVLTSDTLEHLTNALHRLLHEARGYSARVGAHSSKL